MMYATYKTDKHTIYNIQYRETAAVDDSSLCAAGLKDTEARSSLQPSEFTIL